MYVNLEKIILMLKSENDIEWNVNTWHNQYSIHVSTHFMVSTFLEITTHDFSLLSDDFRTSQYSDSAFRWLTQGIGVWLPEGARVFLVTKVSKPPYEHPTSYSVGSEDSSQGMKLTACLHLVPSLRIHGAIPPLLHMPSLCGARSSTRTTLPSPLPYF
jgi:hypothetical protein